MIAINGEKAKSSRFFFTFVTIKLNVPPIFNCRFEDHRGTGNHYKTSLDPKFSSKNRLKKMKRLNKLMRANVESFMTINVSFSQLDVTWSYNTKSQGGNYLQALKRRGHRVQATAVDTYGKGCRNAELIHTRLDVSAGRANAVYSSLVGYEITCESMWLKPGRNVGS